MGWLNARDLLHTNGLFVVGSDFASLRAVEWLTGRPTRFNPNGMTVDIRTLPSWSRYRFLAGANKYIQQESTFWRRGLWEKAGGELHAAYGDVGDFDLWVRFFRHARLYSVDALIGGYRFHPDAISSSNMQRYNERRDKIIESELKSIPRAAAVRVFRRVSSAVKNIGASKAAADLAAQEYGRYFGLNVGVFRGGCLTGPSRSGVELHGFLSYLVKATVTGKKYSVFGYKGKQVRDNIHSHDVIRAIEEFATNPRPGEVYNMGGGRENSVSVLEAISKIEKLAGRKLEWHYTEQARRGDHICYISNLAKFRTHYPNWRVTLKLDAILEELVANEKGRQKHASARQ
jgi:hypothetical protein